MAKFEEQQEITELSEYLVDQETANQIVRLKKLQHNAVGTKQNFDSKIQYFEDAMPDESRMTTEEGQYFINASIGRGYDMNELDFLHSDKEQAELAEYVREQKIFDALDKFHDTIADLTGECLDFYNTKNFAEILYDNTGFSALPLNDVKKENPELFIK